MSSLNYGVELDDAFSDEHGPVMNVRWEAHPDDEAKRDELARIADDIASRYF